MKRNIHHQITIAVAATFVFAAGCPKPAEQTPEESAVESTDPGSEPQSPASGGGGSDVSPSQPAVGLTLADLHPVIREVGEPGIVPEKIVVELSQPVVNGAGAQVTDATRLTFDPPVEATLSFRSGSTLELVPNRPLAPATRYTVTLESLQTQSGVVSAEAGAHSRVFSTPAFAFHRADLAAFDAKRRRLEVDLVFTAPVALGGVKSRATWKVNGASPSVSYQGTGKPNVVRAVLTHEAVRPRANIVLTLAAGVPYAADNKVEASRADATIRIPEGKAMRIFASSVKEGASGFYIHVVCTDDASGEGETYYWDDQTQQSWYVSRRCVLDDSDARDVVHFEPPVKFTLSPTRGGFRLLGDFRRGSYSMRIDGDARTADGGTLQAPYSTSFSVPARGPQVSFVSQGRYLPRDAWKNLAVRHMNLSKLEVRVRHVRPENLAFWLTAEQETADDRNSDLVLKREVPLSGKADELTTSWVDVGAMMPEAPRGVLEVHLVGKGADARSRVLVTDLNLIAKHEDGSDRVRVWAIGIHDNRAISGVEMSQIVSSGRAISTCTTGGDGGCVLEGVGKNAVDPARPIAIIAKKGDELTYLTYAELQAKIEDAAVQGRPYSAETPYSAAIYSDRGVYRPGDIAHVVAILRDKKSEAPKAGMPVSVELMDPRQKVAKKLTEKTNDAGIIALDFPFADFADTGSWRVVLSAGKKRIGEYSFSVEEFVPERMKVTAEASPQDVLVLGTSNVAVEARYLFGGSAEGSPVELTCELQPTQFSPAKNGNYNYGVWREKEAQPIPLGAATGTLGAGGKTSIACPALAGRGTFSGPARLLAKVSVFESGSGRTTIASATAKVHPERFYVGLQTGVEKVESGRPFTVEGIVVDWAGEPVDLVNEVDVSLYRVEREHDWVYDDLEGHWSYRQYERLSLDGETKAKVKNGRFSVTLTAGADGGGFVVRAAAREARVDMSLDGNGNYWWWWGNASSEDRTPRPMRPASVVVTAPNEVKVGEKVNVVFDAPFKGRALFTVETDHVLKTEWVDVPAAGRVEWSFTLETFAPNVYASALVIKDPHLDSKEAFLPSRGFGVRSMRVLPEAFTQPLTVEVPSEVRSNSELLVKLDLGKVEEKMFVTVAAVDEGILSLTRFVSPDPFQAIFDPRALGVQTFETVGWNLLLPAGDIARSTGGDASGAAPGRVQPIKPVALWSGVVTVPENGKLTVPFKVPQYRGSLRVMVVAAGQRRMAKASKNVLVRDPIVLQATLPRFLGRGDTIEMPVFVTNLSGKAQKIAVSVSAEALAMPGTSQPEGLKAPQVLKLVESNQQMLELANEESGTVVFGIQAMKAVGAAKVRVIAKAGEHTSEESLDVPFIPAAPRERTVQRIELTGGRTDLLPLLGGWMPTTERTTFWVTANPYGQAFDHLKYLIRYPYGCIEQTTSSTRPLLFVGKLVSDVDPSLVAIDRIEGMVMSGVNRVLSMQTPEGGFSYWPGGSEPVAWGTAYATHMLLDAQKLRYPVPESRVNDALAWMERELSGNQRARSSYYSKYAEPYMHYVLALGGRGKKAAMAKELEALERTASGAARDGEWQEAVYLLKAGLYAAGDQRYKAELENPDTSPVGLVRKNGWSFYSDRRRRGLMLSTYVDLFGKGPGADALAQLVAESLSSNPSHWYTTQELVWGITGLGKLIGEVTKTYEPAELLANGKKVAPETEASGSDRTWSIYRSSEYASMAVSIKKPDDAKVYLIISSEGVREGAKYATGGDGLALVRSHRSATGEPLTLTGGGLALGDVIYTVIEVANTSNERIQNIALVDRFPAGWEIENPRLGRGGSIDWIDADELWNVDYMNLRDDRIELFGALERGESKKVVYMLRAVTAGRFTAPPVEAGAMYDPMRWAREAGGEVVISAPWGSRGR